MGFSEGIILCLESKIFLVSSLYSWDKRECNPSLDQFIDCFVLFHSHRIGPFCLGLFFVHGRHSLNSLFLI